jgi:hypothetical protein
VRQSTRKKPVGDISGYHGGEYRMLRPIVWYKLTDISEVLTDSSIIRAIACSTHRPDDGGCKHL